MSFFMLDGLEKFEFTDFTDHTSMGGSVASGTRQESHAEREILLVFQGSVNFFLAGRSFAASPGKAFFINSWVPHQLGYGNIDGNITHVWVHLHARRLFAMPYELTRGERLHSCGMWEFPAPMLEIIRQRWDQALTAHAELKNKHYGSIVRMLLEDIEFQTQSAPAEKRREDELINWVKNYISMNYGRNSSLAELEHLTGFNRRHLMRRFKSECSMTIGEYINCVRRGFASAAGKRLSQKEIAFQLGFKSPAAFWLWQKRDKEKSNW